MKFDLDDSPTVEFYMIIQVKEFQISVVSKIAALPLESEVANMCIVLSAVAQVLDDLLNIGDDVARKL
jgi:hypothetical protein